MEITDLNNSTIRLRALEPGDLDFLYKVENDPNVWEVSNTQVPYSNYVLKQYLQHAHRDIFEVKQLRLVIEGVASRNTLGFVDLFEFDPKNQRIGVGLIVYGQENQRKGYAKNSLELIKGYCFNQLHVHQLFANIGQDNTASKKLFESCGFELIGVKKDWVKVQGKFKDELLYQCIDE